jgi:hypothetical protein
MEFEQIIKRLDWLDDEHRKDKTALDTLVEKLANTERELRVANKKIKELGTELSLYSNISARIDQFHDALGLQQGRGQASGSGKTLPNAD